MIKKNSNTLKPIQSKKIIEPKLNTLVSTNKNLSTTQKQKFNKQKKVQKIFESLKKKQWTSKKGEQYDGVLEYDQPQLQQDQYFELQIQKSIKNDLKISQKQKNSLPIPKNQVILPKLKKQQQKQDPNEGKSLKMLEKEMDEQMNRLMYQQMERYQK